MVNQETQDQQEIQENLDDLDSVEVWDHVEHKALLDQQDQQERKDLTAHLEGEDHPEEWLSSNQPYQLTLLVMERDQAHSFTQRAFQVSFLTLKAVKGKEEFPAFLDQGDHLVNVARQVYQETWDYQDLGVSKVRSVKWDPQDQMERQVSEDLEDLKVHLALLDFRVQPEIQEYQVWKASKDLKVTADLVDHEVLAVKMDLQVLEVTLVPLEILDLRVQTEAGELLEQLVNRDPQVI